MPKEIEITEWKPREKNTLRGFFSMTLPSGMIIHDCMLHQLNTKRWVGLPSREYTAEGETKYARLIEFTDREIADKFRDLTLAALDRYFVANGSGNEQRQNQRA